MIESALFFIAMAMWGNILDNAKTKISRIVYFIIVIMCFYGALSYYEYNKILKWIIS